MIKTFCDSCGKEIVKGEEVASITSIENTFFPTPNSATSKAQPVQITRLACGDCFKKIKKILYDK